MPPLSKFGTERFPLHCSQIPELMACPWKSVMKFIDADPRTSSGAADTGSAMHKAASHWHKHGKEVDAALAAMRKARAEFPMADLLEAERLFRVYAADSRNSEANVVACEYHLSGEVGSVFFEGTTDQIRETEEWEIWDIKTSKKGGAVIRDDHTYQLCAYAVLASRKFGRPVKPGGVIMPRGYPNEDRVFYPYFITSAQAERMVLHVVERVKDVRAGRVPPIPGDHCGFCIGTKACLLKHDSYTERHLL